jgi:topoisomerase IA-like protein
LLKQLASEGKQELTAKGAEDLGPKFDAANGVKIFMKIGIFGAIQP